MEKDIIDRFVDFLSETDWTDDISCIHSCAMEFKEEYDYKHKSPQALIHYCIYLAMEHEEGDMQMEMERFLSMERQKMRAKFLRVLLDKVNESEHKKDFINDMMKELK